MADTTKAISSEIMRRFILGKQGLWPGRRWRGEDGTAKALNELGAVQMDPVTIVAPSHHIVLWGRVIDYKSDYLDQLSYQKRRFFDYGGALFLSPMDELPYWRVPMERRKSEKRWADFSAANASLLDAVRGEIEERGPLRKRDLAGDKVENYRGSKDSSIALYYLWLMVQVQDIGNTLFSGHRLQIARMVRPLLRHRYLRHNIVNFVRLQLIAPDVIEAEE